MWILKKVEYMPTNAEGWVCLLSQPTETQGILRPSHRSLTQPMHMGIGFKSALCYLTPQG